ncbi:hypothetical protein BBF96_06235 [Anoxybacter fermentans]|uniref:Sporulation sigma-E factor-processing peptidase n=1 Tax=Anoxybacter fermentans TaxID=1323375 RepID=A0A3Q9HPX2_9FIRM|nr:sigma-E processing peptidase SpoIIGA [Anoxybacter fermentans]AZR73030.1 hypothetical protein BBF96_06235 [Anoxybacter fermentans]
MGTQKLVINLDVLFLNDLVMTLVLLWATARFSGLRVRFGPLFISGIVGSLYTVILVLPLFSGLSDSLYIFLHLLLNLTVASLMIRIAFGLMKWKKFIKTLGYFYLITFLAGGAALSIYFVVGSSPAQWVSSWIEMGNVYGWLYLAAIGVALIVGRHGWNLIRERFYKEKYSLKFRVWIDEQMVQVLGLMDTGNLLRDPLTNLPVIVMEIDALMGLFPTEIRTILGDEELDLIDKVEKLLQSKWFHRFQVIPFSSLGTEGGLMIGCRPDRVEIVGKEIREVGRIILALYQGVLDKEGDYQALLHPELLEMV